MMNEFNNRMNVQRQVLAIVNKQDPVLEELCGLSEATISRWAVVNDIAGDAEVLQLLRKIGDKLSFLATKSQEQVSDEYQSLSVAVDRLTEDLRIAMG